MAAVSLDGSLAFARCQLLSTRGVRCPAIVAPQPAPWANRARGVQGPGRDQSLSNRHAAACLRVKVYNGWSLKIEKDSTHIWRSDQWAIFGSVTPRVLC